MADALVLGASTSVCGFKSHLPHHQARAWSQIALQVFSFFKNCRTRPTHSDFDRLLQVGASDIKLAPFLSLFDLFPPTKAAILRQGTAVFCCFFSSSARPTLRRKCAGQRQRVLGGLFCGGGCYAKSERAA